MTVEFVGLVIANKIQSGRGKQIGYVKSLVATLVFRESIAVFPRVLWVVAVEVIGVIILRTGLVQEADKLVKPFPLGCPGCVLTAQSPLADQSRVVAGPVEDLGQGQVIRLECGRVIAQRQRVSCMQSGHQRVERACECGAACVETGEAHAFRRHPVDIRRLYSCLAVAPEIAITEAIGKNDHEVGSARRGKA